MQNKPVIYWFRQDLRLHDNITLIQAAAAGHPLLPVYIFEEESIRPWGSASKWWLHHSLQALNDQLGGHICFKRGDPTLILAELATQTGAQDIFWARRYDKQGRETDARVQRSLATNGIHCHPGPSNLLHEPGIVLSKAHQSFQVFTPYWRQSQEQLRLESALPAPSDLALYQAPGDLLDDWNLLPTASNWAKGLEATWIPGEKQALCQLESFIHGGLAGYADRRNRPDHPGTSRLSPHLHWGEISPRMILNTVQKVCLENPHLEADADVFLSELGWREFSHDCLERFPDLTSRPLRPGFENFPWEDRPDHLQAWQQGQTGYPIVDAGMRQLWHTGWMHNRVRMIVASFLTKHLLIPWQAGEQWFWNTLVDADEASNGMGWQWVAGCGMDASPYFRIFNPVLQGEKFDPQGNYVRQWVPELSDLPAAYIHQPWKAPPTILSASVVTLGKTYPHPIVDHGIARARALKAYQEMRG